MNKAIFIKQVYYDQQCLKMIFRFVVLENIGVFITFKFMDIGLETSWHKLHHIPWSLEKATQSVN